MMDDEEKVRYVLEKYFEKRLATDPERAEDETTESRLCISYDELMRTLDEERFARYVVKDTDRFLSVAEEVLESILKSTPELNNIELSLNFPMRLKNSSESRCKNVGELRYEDMYEFRSVRGVVVEKRDVGSKMCEGVFRCAYCGEKIKKRQRAFEIEPPEECYCCGKDRDDAEFPLVLDESDHIEFQNITIQDDPEKLREGEIPSTLRCYVKEDVSLLDDITMGARVVLHGILEGMPMRYDNGGISRITLKRLRITDVESHQVSKDDSFKRLDLTESDKKEIKEAAEDPRMFAKIVNSIAPSINGLLTVQEGLALQLFGGVGPEGGLGDRGDIHVLLIGDPEGIVSNFMTSMSKIIPKWEYRDCRDSGGAGLIGKVVNEDHYNADQENILGGTLVYADGDFALIENLEYVDEKNKTAMPKAMERQYVVVERGGLKTCLRSRCSILASASPKSRKSKDDLSTMEQIYLDRRLLSSFDMVFTFEENEDDMKRKKLAEKTLNLHDRKIVDELLEPEVDYEFLRKYIAYARTIDPNLPDGVKQRIEEICTGLEGRPETTSRLVGKIVRLTEASARAHLRKEAAKKDVERAEELTKEKIG